MRFTLEQAIKRNNNNFDLIRLLAALIVIYGHSFEVYPANGKVDIVSRLPLNEFSGTLAVDIFFFLSGIFITASFLNSKTNYRFILMRIFRIWPALIVCTLITVFVIGPIFTEISHADYFRQGQTWRYLVNNTVMLKFERTLPGVFKHHFFSAALNTSLWTLPTEIRCYILVFVTGVTGLLKRKSTVIGILLFFILFNNTHLLSLLVFNGSFKQMLFFVAGMAAYKLKEYLLLDYKIALTLLTACLAGFYINHLLFLVLFYCAFLYCIILIATVGIVKKIKLPGDYSYGVYIYGFLVQQLIAQFLPKISAYPSMVYSLPITFTLGVISWHLIELPALNFAKKLVEQRETHLEDIKVKVD